MRTRRSHIQQLRTAIDCMPAQTRAAMLAGVRANAIITGAYVDGAGGICPMLAAHRNGGRSDCLSFAHAWDRFTGQSRRARRATRRELAILISHLEESLLSEQQVDLGAAIAAHRASRANRPGTNRPGTKRPRPGDPDRSVEMRRSEGWSWMRPFRRYDDYTRALHRLQADAELLEAHAAVERELIGEPA